jgi:hypothetical protein
MESTGKRPKLLRQCRWGIEYLTNGSDFLPRTRVIDVIVAEHALREQIQREETLKHRAIALQKSTYVESDKARLEEANRQLEKTNEQLETAKRDFSRKMRVLYLAESMLPAFTRELYDRIRGDDTWFMGEGMVQDCSDRGGCCSRECGCCAERHRSKPNKGGGHCTSECWCCINFRGFDLPEKEKEDIRSEIKDRLDPENSPFLMNMATWFFFPSKSKKKLQPGVVPKQKSRLQKIFGRTSG